MFCLFPWLAHFLDGYGSAEEKERELGGFAFYYGSVIWFRSHHPE
jgi:hypothetical protein